MAHKLTRRKVVVGMAGTAALPLFNIRAHAQNAIEIRVQHPNPPTSLPHLVVEEVANRIMEKSEGRLKLTIYPSGQLGNMTDSIEQASQGEPVICYAQTSYFAPFGVPEFNIMSGPFLIASSDQGERFATSSLFQSWCDRLAENSNVRVLAQNWFEGARHVIGKAAYPSPAEIAGVKIRVPPVASYQTTFQLMGAVPTTVDVNETYSALSQGVVDAAEHPLSAIPPKRWQEVARFLTLTSHFNQFDGWSISESTLKSLAPADRDMMIQEFLDGGREMSRRANDNLASIRADFEAQGVSFVDADLPAYQKVTEPFYQQFTDWPAGLLDKVRSIAGAA